MTYFAKNSRAKHPIEDLQIDGPDELNHCTHCQARTEITAHVENQNAWLEQCCHCAQRYLVANDITTATN